MTEWTTSAVLIAPAAQRDAANALAAAMGWGPDCYSVPLSASGAAPATHWGLHAWVAEGFAATLAAAARGALAGALILSIEPGLTDPAGHFARVVESAGLTLAEQGPSDQEMEQSHE